MSETKNQTDTVQMEFKKSINMVQEHMEMFGATNIQEYDVVATYGISLYQIKSDHPLHGVPMGIDLFDNPRKGMEVLSGTPYGIAIEPYPIHVADETGELKPLDHFLLFPEAFVDREEAIRTFLQILHDTNPGCTIAVISNQSGLTDGPNGKRERIKCHCSGGGYPHVHFVVFPKEEMSIDDLELFKNDCLSSMTQDLMGLNQQDLSIRLIQGLQDDISDFKYKKPQLALYLSNGNSGIGFDFSPKEPFNRPSGMTRTLLANTLQDWYERETEGHHLSIQQMAQSKPEAYRQNMLNLYKRLNKLIAS